MVKMLVVYRRRPLPVCEENDAALVLTGFFLCVYSRALVIKAANNIYRKIKDDESGVDFFANTITGETSWTKPKVYLTTEPLLLLQDSQNKRSPRVNREKITALTT
jgi:hypothetical protein